MSDLQSTTAKKHQNSDSTFKVSPLQARGFGVQQKAEESTPATKTELWENYQQAKQLNQKGVNASAPALPIQAKLTIGEPGDKYEQEADSMAAQVMQMPEPGLANSNITNSVQARSIQPIQRACTECQEEQKEESKPEEDGDQIQAKEEYGQTPELTSIQREVNSAEDPESGSNLESQLNGSKGGGSPLTDEVRGFMEPRFGADFGDVRVHTGSDAVQMNGVLNAQAFAHGSDIYFGVGKSPGNNELTAHELTHVVQQTGQVQSQAAPGGSPDASAPIRSSTTFTQNNITKEVHGATLSLVGAAMSSAGTGEAASVLPALKPEPQYEYDEKDEKVTKVAVTIVETKEMPVWAELGQQCQPIKNEWNRFYSALDKHEEEHVAIDRKHYKDVHRKMVGKPKEISYATLDAVTEAANLENQAHDLSTRNGRRDGTDINGAVQCGIEKVSTEPGDAGLTSDMAVPESAEPEMMAKRRGLTDIIQPDSSIDLMPLSEGMPYFIQRDTPNSLEKDKSQKLWPEAKGTRIDFQPVNDTWVKVTADPKDTNFQIMSFIADLQRSTTGLKDLDTFINATPGQFKVINPILGNLVPSEPLTDESIKYIDNVCRVVKQEASNIKRLAKSYEVNFEILASTKIIGGILNESQRSVEKERDRLGIKSKKTDYFIYTAESYEMSKDRDEDMKKSANELLSKLKDIAIASEDLQTIKKEQEGERQSSDYGGTSPPGGLPNKSSRNFTEELDEANGRRDELKKQYNQSRLNQEIANPILITYQLDCDKPETVATLHKILFSPQERAETLGKTIEEKLSSIEKVRKDISDKPSRIWRLPPIVAATDPSNFPELSKSLKSSIVSEKVANEEFEKAFVDIALPVLAVGAAFLATPAAGAAIAGAGAAGATVAGTAAVIDAGLTIAMGVRSWQEYQFETAAQGTDFDKAKAISQGEDPSLFWLAMDLLPIAGLAFEAAKGALKAAQGAFKSLAALRREAIAAKSAMELTEAGSLASKERYQKALTELEATGNQAKEGSNLGTKLKDEVSKIEGAALEKAGANRLIVAEKVAADGHTIKISADGRIFVCSNCAEIGERFSHELGLAQNEALANELREIETIADATEKSRRAALLEGKLVSEGAARFGQELEKMGLKSDILARLTAEEVYRTRHGLLELVKNDIDKLNLLLPQFKDTVVLERLLTNMGEPVVTTLAPALKEAGLVNLEKLDMIKFDEQMQIRLNKGEGSAVRGLPSLQGKTRGELEAVLTSTGFKSPDMGERGMEVWTHADGSIVRVKLGPQALKGRRTVEHFVKEVSKNPHSYSQGDIFAKVADNGAAVPAGPKFAREQLNQWFKKQASKTPNPTELDALLTVWADAGHIDIIP